MSTLITQIWRRIWTNTIANMIYELNFSLWHEFRWERHCIELLKQLLSKQSAIVLHSTHKWQSKLSKSTRITIKRLICKDLHTFNSTLSTGWCQWEFRENFCSQKSQASEFQLTSNCDQLNPITLNFWLFKPWIEWFDMIVVQHHPSSSWLHQALWLIGKDSRLC